MKHYTSLSCHQLSQGVSVGSNNQNARGNQASFAGATTACDISWAHIYHAVTTHAHNDVDVITMTEF